MQWKPGMKVLTFIGIAILLFCSACAANHYALRPNDSTDEALVIENTDHPERLVIIVEGPQSLKDTLDRLKCRKRPCMIGRVGEVYIVERPEVD